MQAKSIGFIACLLGLAQAGGLMASDLYVSTTGSNTVHTSWSTAYTKYPR